MSSDKHWCSAKTCIRFEFSLWMSGKKQQLKKNAVKTNLGLFMSTPSIPWASPGRCPEESWLLGCHFLQVIWNVFAFPHLAKNEYGSYLWFPENLNKIFIGFAHIGMAKRIQNASGAPYFWVPCSHKCHCSLGLHGVKVRAMHFADFWSQKFSWKPQASNNYHMSWIICHTALISQRNTDLLVRWFVYKSMS